jgi:hypothetical protein
VGPLSTAQGNYKYAVVIVEYFTKWIKTKKVFWQNIICQFRVPREMTMDNAK